MILKRTEVCYVLSGKTRRNIDRNCSFIFVHRAAVRIISHRGSSEEIESDVTPYFLAPCGFGGEALRFACPPA